MSENVLIQIYIFSSFNFIEMRGETPVLPKTSSLLILLVEDIFIILRQHATCQFFSFPLTRGVQVLLPQQRSTFHT